MEKFTLGAGWRAAEQWRYPGTRKTSHADEESVHGIILGSDQGKRI